MNGPVMRGTTPDGRGDVFARIKQAYEDGYRAGRSERPPLHEEVAALADDPEFLREACLEPSVLRLWADVIRTATERLRERGDHA